MDMERNSLEEILVRSRQATRVRENAQFKAESARIKQFQQGSLLEGLTASPLTSEAIAQEREQWGITGR